MHKACIDESIVEKRKELQYHKSKNSEKIYENKKLNENNSSNDKYCTTKLY